MIGKVLEYVQGSYIIKFTVPLYIEKAEAIPMNGWDRPNEGDEVYIFQDDDLFGGQFVYHKMGTRDEKIHKMQTDTLDITLDEDSDLLDINYKDTCKVQIDLGNKKINVEYPDAEITLDAKKLHLGNDSNQPAVLGDEYEKRFKELYNMLASHKHGTSMGPSTPPLPPEMTKWQSTLPNQVKNDLSKNVDLIK